MLKKKESHVEEEKEKGNGIGEGERRVFEEKTAGEASGTVKKKPGHRREAKIKVSRKEWEKMEEKAKKADEYFDQVLRMKAEFENYRKRMNREREEFAKFAAEELIYDLLMVIDNLENAVSAAKKTEDFHMLLEGVELTRKEALRVLSQWGLEEVKAKGEKFDPEKHEAVMQVDSDEEEGKIVEEMRKGYCLKGKLIRPSMVKVARRNEDEQNNRD